MRGRAGWHRRTPKRPRGRVRPRPSVPSWSTCPALTSMCWPWSTSSLGPLLRIQTEALRIQPEALDSPDFVEIGAKPARQDQRGRRNGGGSPWVPPHDRGPGGPGFQWSKSGRGHPQPQTDLEAAPPPPQSRPERHPNFNHSYIVSAYFGALQHFVTIIADY